MTYPIHRTLLTLGAALLASVCVVSATPARVEAQLGFSISVGSPPPPLPFYEQPDVPGLDYMWTPGYWAWGPDGYFWVPGAWVLAPRPGLLWTPGYWAWDGEAYTWYPGYWSRRVGYYGGINYGYGYFGHGYGGGRWYGPHFRYNTFVTRVNTRVIHNVYVDRTVVVDRPVDRTVTRVSYNGGRGGIVASPLASERVVIKHTIPMTTEQEQHFRVAASDRNQLAIITHGQPRQIAVVHAFSDNRRPPTFEHVRPGDRVTQPNAPVRGAALHGNAVRDNPVRNNPVQGAALHSNAGEDNRPSHTPVRGGALRPEGRRDVVPQNMNVPRPAVVHARPEAEVAPVRPVQPERPTAAPTRATGAPAHPTPLRVRPGPPRPMSPHPTPRPPRDDRESNQSR